MQWQTEAFSQFYDRKACLLRLLPQGNTSTDGTFTFRPVDFAFGETPP